MQNKEGAAANMKVDNAVIMAAGLSSRFAPLSAERPKGLVEVRGEVLIERQIRQLLEAGVPKVYIVTGYKSEAFAYLRGKFSVELIFNPDYLTRNNNASIRCAQEILRNSYLCSSDNYFLENPFETQVDETYYAAEYAAGETGEWCLTEDGEGYINSVTVGGRDSWYMMGHTFWSESFSRKFLEILDEEYDRPETAGKLWETIYMEHLDVLKMRIRKYNGVIFEFDTLEELRQFDGSYIEDTRSAILKKIARQLGIRESEITNVRTLPSQTAESQGFSFNCPAGQGRYLYANGDPEIIQATPHNSGARIAK